MRTRFVVGAVCLLMADVVVGDQIPAKRVIGLNIERKRASPETALLRRSSIDAPQYNTNNGYIYTTNVTIGNPPQPIVMQIDTGSADFWVNTPSSSLCSGSFTDPAAVGAVGCAFGTYSTNESSSSHYLSSNFIVSYAVSGMASGDFVTDDMTVGGVIVKALQLGVGYNSTVIPNLWGISFPAAEGVVTVAAQPQSQYNNSVQQMVSQGLIQSPTYSLWLNDAYASQGSLLFGGIDTSKYQGQLQVLPLVPSDARGVIDQLYVNMTSISLSTGGSNMSLTSNTTAFPQRALLDTGTPIITVPSDIYNNVVQALQLITAPGLPVALCDCGLANSSATINFGFAGVSIAVPMRSFVSTPTVIDLALFAKAPPGSIPQGTCIFAMANLASAGGFANILLGDSLLREAYVVYDLANKQVAMAPTNFHPSASTVVEIPAGPGGVAAALQSVGVGSASPSSIAAGSTASSTSSTAPTAVQTTSGASTVGRRLRQGLVYSGVAAMGVFAFVR
ncbi:hypothetical protein MMC15_000197 [Xylographa vitiligo]|nr:hypothetical protein [Xylographa vitiligo]